MRFHLLKDTFEINGNECRTTGDGPNIILRCKSDGARAFAVSGVCGGTKPDLRGWAAMDPVDFQGTYKLVPRPCITITAAMSSKIKIITEIEIVA